MSQCEKKTAAVNAILCDEVHHLVVNGHLLGDTERQQLIGDLLRKLPEIYELARVAA